MLDKLLRIFSRVRELENLLDLSVRTADEWRRSYLAADKGAFESRQTFGRELHAAEQDISAAKAELDRVAKSLQETVAAKSMLEDRLNAAMEDRNRLWGLVETSIAGERTAYQSGLNLQWQKEGFGAPYPDAPQMPPHRVQQPVEDSIVARPMTGSERMAKGTRDFITAHAGRWKDATG